MAAGWAAYCQGKMQEALAQTKQALCIDPNLGEAFFQLAKVHIALNEVDNALPELGKAIERDPFFALKAGGDSDFQKNDDRLRGFLEAIRNEKYQQLMPKVLETLPKISSWAEYTVNGKCDLELHRMELFLRNGDKWSIMDLWDLLNFLKSLEFVRVQMPGKTIKHKESYQLEETYQEEVVVKPGGFFRKAVTEMQDRTRTVTKTRTVKKILPGKLVWVKKININTNSSGIIEEGEFYNGTVRRIMDYGAYVEIFPGKEGLVHISYLTMGLVKDVREVLNEGDKVLVKCLEINKQGRIKLSRKAGLEENLYGGQVITE